MPDSSRRDFLRFVLIALAVMAGVFVSTARAEGIALSRLEISQKGDFFQLSGHFDTELSSVIETALQRGVQLTFVQSVEGKRARDFWLPEIMVEQSRSIRLSYNALFRQYYVSLAGNSQGFELLDEALRNVGDLRDWAIINVKQMKKKSQYSISVRMYLDIAQLPKPLQVNALASSARWQLDSGWQEHTVKY